MFDFSHRIVEGAYGEYYELHPVLRKVRDLWRMTGGELYDAWLDFQIRIGAIEWCQSIRNYPGPIEFCVDLYWTNWG